MTKKLYKSRKDRMLCGVCGGIAEYFEVDPVLVRAIFVILTFAGGSALIAYIISCFIIPERPRDEAPAKSEKPAAEATPEVPARPAPGGYSSRETSQAGALFIGIVLIVLGSILLMRNIPIFDHWWHMFRLHAWPFFWPGIIVIIGLALIIRGMRK